MKNPQLMNGFVKGTEREENDFYATDPMTVINSLEYFKEIGLKGNVFECACGTGNISKVLIDNGYNVYSSDLIDRGFGKVQDFLTIDKLPIADCDILTNPPFKLATNFTNKALDLLPVGGKCVFFLKIQFLESKQREELFKTNQLKEVAVFVNRQVCAKNNDFEKSSGNALCFAWFVFEKGYNGKPTITWI